MAYISKTERALAQWISIPDTVRHICTVEKCEEKNARSQFVSALVDGALGPLRWKDAMSPPKSTSTMTIATDTPPVKGPAWKDANINWNAGTVVDVWGEYKFQQPRVLLLTENCVAKLWPTKHTAGTETQAITFLTQELRKSPDMKRDIAMGMLEKQKIRFTQRGFQNRIWPIARERAGLPRTAQPGRKKNCK